MAKKEQMPPATGGPENPDSGPTQQPAEPAGGGPESNKDARTMAMLCHLLAIFTSFLGPLIIWLVKKDEYSYVDEQGKEALNFQITVVLASFVAGLLTFVCIGVVLLPAIWIVDIVFCIIAAVAVNKGEHYRYPLSLRLIK
jgi:uncharacterized Tic20 family protein